MWSNSHSNSGKPETISAKPQNEQGNSVKHWDCGDIRREAAGGLASQSPTAGRDPHQAPLDYKILVTVPGTSRTSSTYLLSLLTQCIAQHTLLTEELQAANLHTNKLQIPSCFSSLKLNVISAKKLLNSFLLTLTLHCFLLHQDAFYLRQEKLHFIAFY